MTTDIGTSSISVSYNDTAIDESEQAVEGGLSNAAPRHRFRCRQPKHCTIPEPQRGQRLMLRARTHLRIARQMRQEITRLR